MLSVDKKNVLMVISATLSCFHHVVSTNNKQEMSFTLVLVLLFCQPCLNAVVVVR